MPYLESAAMLSRARAALRFAGSHYDPVPHRRRSGPSLARAVGLCEQRLLLDGNVAAVVDHGTLTLKGDEADNSVEITTSAVGIIVRGLNGTTINGSADVFVAFAGTTVLPGDVRIDLKDGDDVALLSGELTIERDVRINAGRGDDRIGLDGVEVEGRVVVKGQTGNDGLYLNDVAVSESVRFESRRGDNTLSVNNSALADDLKFRGGRGNDAAHLDEVTIGGDLRLSLQEGSNGVYLEDTAVSGGLKVRAFEGNDFVMLEDTTVAGPTRLRLYAGADALVVTGATRFDGRFSGDGGVGTDVADLPGDAVFGAKHRLRRFEEDDVPAAGIVAALDAPTTGIRTRSHALRDFFNGLLGP